MGQSNTVGYSLVHIEPGMHRTETLLLLVQQGVVEPPLVVVLIRRLLKIIVMSSSVRCDLCLSQSKQIVSAVPYKKLTTIQNHVYFFH